MNLQLTRLGIVAAVMMAAMGLHAQTQRSDDFKAKYELKEVVVMSRHNIRSPLTSGGAAYTLSPPPNRIVVGGARSRHQATGQDGGQHP
ncbi:MAG: hypothetical protein IKD75_00650 [Prevotella sp.]|nr:hypothetical protein [Prevotella sp.]